MKRKLRQWFSSAIIIATLSQSSYSLAKSISGTISFIKKPPLVGIAYIPSEDSYTSKSEIDQLNKQFTAKMVVAKPGDSVTFRNSDNVDHNVFANDIKQSAKFDVGLMYPGGEKQVLVNWQENSIVRVGCKIHPKMRTYLASIDTPHYEIIEFQKDKKTYTFTIANVPESANTLLFDIPKYDKVTIDLSTDSSWTAKITKNGKLRGNITINKK
jgi:plastocyanin